MVCWYGLGMELTEAHYELVKDCFPPSRGAVELSNLEVLNALVFMARQGCTQRSLPERFGKWQTVYKRHRRWSEKGVLDEVFGRLQEMGVIDIPTPAPDSSKTSSETSSETSGSGEAVGAFMLDSTIVKAHHHAARAQKNTVLSPQEDPAAV